MKKDALLVQANPHKNWVKRYADIRNHSVEICSPLEIEDYVVQPIVDVSPPKWHLGHTTWFFETFILQPNFPGMKFLILSIILYSTVIMKP